MKFKIHLDNAEHQVEVKPDGTVILDGETFQAKVTTPGADRRAVQVGDAGFEVRTVENCKETGIVVVELAGERIPLTVTEVVKGGGGTSAVGPAAGAPAAPVAAPAQVVAQPPQGAAPPEAPEDVEDGIWAPVPGKIVDVRVKAGDTVAEGDLVLILEAMKMENELHATKAAKVTAVLVKKGDQAERGQLLVAFE